MFRSSTSSSRGRRLRLAPLVAVSVLVLAELLLRLPVAADVLGSPDLYYWAGVRERLEAIAETQDDYGDIDILFTGSSVVRTNIRPFEFDGYLADRGVETVSFNGGLSGLRIDAVRLYIEEFWLDVLEPEVVFQAVRYEEVLHPEPAETYVRFEQGKYEPLWLSGSPLAPLQRFALDNLRLAQYAGLLTEALVSPDTAFDEESGFPIDERGWNATVLRLPDVRSRLDDTEIPGGTVVPNGYSDPLDPAGFDLGLSMLAETIAAVRDAGAVYVLVIMPEHGDKFLNAPDGRERYRLYVDTLRNFAEAQGVLFIDVTNGDASVYRTDEPFSDFHHMSPAGALEFTRLLADAFVDADLP